MPCPFQACATSCSSHEYRCIACIARWGSDSELHHHMASAFRLDRVLQAGSHQGQFPSFSSHLGARCSATRSDMQPQRVACGIPFTCFMLKDWKVYCSVCQRCCLIGMICELKTKWFLSLLRCRCSRLACQSDDNVFVSQFLRVPIEPSGMESSW